MRYDLIFVHSGYLVIIEVENEKTRPMDKAFNVVQWFQIFSDTVLM